MHMYEQMLNRAKRASTVQRLTAKIRTLAFSINKARNKTLLENLQIDSEDFIDLECSEGSDDFSDDFSDQMDKIDDDMVQPAQWHSMPYSRSVSPVMTAEDFNLFRLRDWLCWLLYWFYCLFMCFFVCVREMFSPLFPAGSPLLEALSCLVAAVLFISMLLGVALFLLQFAVFLLHLLQFVFIRGLLLVAISMCCLVLLLGAEHAAKMTVEKL